jgi:Transposase DDE domain
VTGLPLAWEVQTARGHESPSVDALLDALASRGIVPATASLDRGYDVTRVYDTCESRGVPPVIPDSRDDGREAR